MNGVYFLILFILVFIIVIHLFYPKTIEKYRDVPSSETREKENQREIPLNIFMTWSSHSLPPKMKENIEHIKKTNPEFGVYVYDVQDCREFIKKNFDYDVLYSYDNLVPYAYKSDLWRYCILYIYGGIYVDVKWKPYSDFKFIDLVNKEHFTLDRPFYNSYTFEENKKLVNSTHYYEKVVSQINPQFWKKGEIGLYNALLVCKPRNPILLETIKKIIENVNNLYYGYNSLYVTGPGLLGDVYFKGDYSKIDNDIDLYFDVSGTYLMDKNKIIMTQYPEYRKEQQMYTDLPGYSDLWKNKKIYLENIIE